MTKALEDDIVSEPAAPMERFYLGACVFYAFCWATMTTVTLVYMVEVAHLDPLQMVLVGTALEVSAFVFEIPTGVVADAFSRKWSVVVGHALTGLGFVIVASLPEFAYIVAAQVVWGFGSTFISGAYPAWLSEEIGVVRANAAFVKAAQYEQVASIGGIATSVALAHVSLSLPILVGALGILLLALAMAVLMRETGFEASGRASWRGMAETFREGTHEIRLQPVLTLILVITLIFGAFSEGIDRLFTPFLIESFEFPALGSLDTVVWWGIIAAVANVVGFAATTVARRTVDLTSHVALTWVLGGLTAAVGLTVAVFANLDSFIWVLALFWLYRGMRSARAPLDIAWLNRRLPSATRATLLSMNGQADAVGQVFGGPVVGVVAKAASISLALTVSALMLLPSLAVYRRAAGASDPDASDAADE